MQESACGISNDDVGLRGKHGRAIVRVESGVGVLYIHISVAAGSQVECPGGVMEDGVFVDQRLVRGVEGVVGVDRVAVV